MYRRLAMIATAILCIAPMPTVGCAQDALPPPPVVVREGEHFRVLCHFDTERLADETLAAVEGVWDIAHALLPGAPTDAGVRDIHLYRNAGDYALADAHITGSQFASNMAFSWQATHESHVALQPDHDDSVFALGGMPNLTLRAAVHEAGHLVVYDNIANHGDHPAWLAEGLATLIADRAMTASGLSPAAHADPICATRMVMVRTLLDANTLPTPRQIIDGDIDGVPSNARYALWWTFFRFLSETGDGSAVEIALETARSTGGGPEFSARLASRVEKAWGKRRLDRMNDDFRAYVKSQEPEWEEVFRSLTVRGQTWVQLAFGGNNAIAWNTRPVGSSRYVIEGTFEILHSANPQLNLLLGRSGNDFVSLAFRADFGVTIFGYRSATDSWTRVGNLETASVKRGARVPFEVSVSGSQLTVRVADEKPLSWKIEDHDLSGPWGVGAQAGGAGIWRDVTLR